MDQSVRRQMIMDFLKEIDFMKNYSYSVMFMNTGAVYVNTNPMHKKHIRKLNKILKKAGLDHIEVKAEYIIKKQNP